jgi:ABC-2 type transport system permease protein
MYNLIRADFFKMRKSATIKILFAIACLYAAAMVVISYMIEHGKLSTSMSGIGFLLSDVDVISILGGVCAGVFICGDFDNKTIHDAIAGGCGRFSVIISKATVFICSVVVLLVPYAIAVGVALGTGSKFSLSTPGLGFLNLLMAEGGTGFSVLQGWGLFGIILLLLLVYAAQLSLCVPLAFVFKKPVAVIAVFYALSILCGQLAGLEKSSKLFNDIFACTPFGGNYALLTLGAGAGDVCKAIAVSVVFITVMLAATYTAFRKAEIK